jgi:hypothetical protein
MLNRRTTILWLVLAAALFALLLGARSLVSSVSQVKPDVQGKYDALGQALQQANLLPLGGDEEFLFNLASLARDVNTVDPKGEPSPTGGTLTLGDVIEATSAERNVIELKLRPRYYSQLLPGPLATVLRDLTRLAVKAQLEAGGAPGAAAGARFTITVAQTDYECLVTFTGKTLDEISIVQK